MLFENVDMKLKSPSMNDNVLINTNMLKTSDPNFF